MESPREVKTAFPRYACPISNRTDKPIEILDFETSCDCGEVSPRKLTVPANGTVGTCGRNTIRGPDFAQWDLAFVKNTKIGKTNLQLRI